MNPSSKMSSKKVRSSNGSSSKLLTKKLLGDHGDELEQQPQHQEGSSATSGWSSPEHQPVDEAASSSLAASPGGNGEGLGGLVRRTSSVESILRSLAAGSTVASTPWKLTRAVVHLEDAWKGRVYPCPPLETKDPATRALFKLRWRYRSLEFLVVHLLLCKCILSEVVRANHIQ